MTDRQAKILDTIIREYVKTAEPVSSAWLAEECGFDCSPATLRAEMNTLEEEGYLQQPHTSAGRIPTDQAYRSFVNNLLAEKQSELPEKDKQLIDRTITPAKDNPYQLSHNLAKTIAQLTDQLAISGIVDTNEFFKSGFNNIFSSPEFQLGREWGQFGSLFDEFEDFYRALLGDIPDDGVTIYIGEETPAEETQDESVIITRYPLPNGLEGLSAVIGPTRMRYGRNLAVLKYINGKMKRLE